MLLFIYAYLAHLIHIILSVIVDLFYVIAWDYTYIAINCN